MDRIDDILGELESQNNRRYLRVTSRTGEYIEVGTNKYLDMSSNDYLGLAADNGLQREFLTAMGDCDRFLMSNPASRLITGNSPEYEELESALSGLYPERAALVLGSGYAVNTSALPAVTSAGDTILADKYVHASIIDGLRLCECDWHRFAHNDMNHLESLLRKTDSRKGQIWVATESVFSMDGDRASLRDLIALKEKYGFSLYLDEAHAFGVFGDGRGLAAEAGLAGYIDITVGTFGKACASAGGFIVCETMMRELLINRMRSLIFSTALPPIVLLWTKYVIERFPDMDVRRSHLSELILEMSELNPGLTQIIPVMTYDNAKALLAADKFREEGYWVTPVRYPTVPKGKSRIRLSLTAIMTREDIQKFKTVCSNILQ